MPQVRKLRDKRRLKKPRPLTGGGKVLSPTTVKKVTEEYQVMCLRRDGHTIKEIADSLGMTPSLVSERIKSSLQYIIKETSETSEEHRQLELERYDALLKWHMPMAAVGNLASAQIVLSVSTARRKLLALDVPEVKKLEVSGVREYVGVDMDKV